MSENKLHRGVPEIQNDYSRVCAQLGHVEYQISVFKKDADRLKKELEGLNLEAAASSAAKAAEENKAPAEEAKQGE